MILKDTQKDGKKENSYCLHSWQDHKRAHESTTASRHRHVSSRREIQAPSARTGLHSKVCGSSSGFLALSWEEASSWLANSWLGGPLDLEENISVEQKGF